MKILFSPFDGENGRGVARGEYGYIPPKSVKVNFLWGKMASERLLNSFMPPKNFYTPKTNFWLRPWKTATDTEQCKDIPGQLGQR